MTTSLEGFFEETTKRKYELSKLAQKEWKDFALYTVESRAIPNMIDGLKTVQRMYVYSSIQNSKTDYKKVSAIAGVVSDYGYNHGEASAASAGQLMASEWANNICLIEGRGSFGTRLVQSAAASRYTYTRLHKNFSKYIKDIDLAPIHEDPEHLPPKFYVPVIPLVLSNGIKGIATGFATNILPRCPDALIEACKEYLTTGSIKEKVKVKFPDFNGSVTYNKDENRYYCNGIFNKKSKTVLEIIEVPYSYDREGYVNVLNKLEDDGYIVSYEDQCDKTGFKFEVKLKQGFDWNDDFIVKQFKLSKPYTENLTVIDQYNKLKEYEDERDLIIDFCNYRSSILEKRIELRKNESNEEIRWLSIKRNFIEAILENKIIFKNKKKVEVTSDIMKYTAATVDDCDRLLRINILSLTKEMILELDNEIKEMKSKLKYWESTTPKEQFMNDIKEISK